MKDYTLNGLNYKGMCYDGSEKYPNLYYRNQSLFDAVMFAAVMILAAVLVHALAS